MNDRKKNMDSRTDSDFSVQLKNSNKFNSNWFNQISKFHVICIYESKKLNADDITSQIEREIPKLDTTFQVYSKLGGTTIYIVWDSTYQENKDLFIELRYTARDEMVLRIARNIVLYLVKRYEEYNGMPAATHPKLKDKEHIHFLIQKFYITLKKSTFLKDNMVWEDFCNFFNEHLIEWTFQDMEYSIGNDILRKMDKLELNERFLDYLSKNVKENRKFQQRFLEIVNHYTEEWMHKIVKIMDLEQLSLQKLEFLLHIQSDQVYSELLFRKNYHVVNKGNLEVMSNSLYQSTREALSQNTFDLVHSSPWPTALLRKGQLTGSVKMMPSITSNENEMDLANMALKQVVQLSELDVDVLDALCAYYLTNARHYKDIVEIHIDYLLSLRGLKPKLSGNGRRGGYEKSQRYEVLKSLTRIQSLWIDIDQVVIYTNGKPEHVSLKGRPFVFKDRNNKEYEIDDKSLEGNLYYTVGDIFEKFLYGSGRQVALLPMKTLQYNPYKEKIEKRLIRYLSWRWRTQARKADYFKPYKMSTLLEVIGLEINKRVPSRSRDRMEQALDRLVADGLISSWQYEKWEEDIASYKGWAQIWKDSTLQIMPPKRIVEQYQSIEWKQKKKTNGELVSVNPEVEVKVLGEQIRKTRSLLHLSLQRVAEELEISTSYLSNIERGAKTPSSHVQRRLITWLQKNYIYD
ncbi:helix-turn-helix domain-containing protein [Oceanobacillus halophilus]|uniref:XRE family transcriptional regulator n=1 Tax=Oceanobacillus halophilus TaxID=930130 RepID=A0A494ZUI8_9BACI|nr:helix-turn-helix transcriptional regulator [Oceanobacillus halophilus]RKQ29992.1 XRE family transcriptional regulator [Oceanobacillus halophilus]